MAILAVTGMASEARIARGAGIEAIVLGGPPPHRLAVLEAAIAAGVSGLVSFGIAGALDPALVPGTILVPGAVRTDTSDVFRCHETWTANLRASLSRASAPVAAGLILGADHIVPTRRLKRAMFAQTGAVAVDIESGAVARMAMRTGIPFVVLRAIADPASRDLPPAAAVGLDDDGRPALGSVLMSVAIRPWQVPALIRLALETRRALQALARAADALLPSAPG
ncbi:MAG: hypothetical protein ACREFD_07590 [Stellaceae bacterium]